MKPATIAARTLQVLLIAASVAFLFTVAVLSDYSEVGVLLLGAGVIALALALTWNTSHRIVRACLVLFVLIALAGSGTLLIRAGAYQKQVNAMIARAMLRSVGGALERMQQAGVPLPDCDWVCMGGALKRDGYWTGLTLRFEGTDQTTGFLDVPMKDGWGCRYEYQNLGGGRFMLRSSGADRRFGTGDDLIYLPGTPDEPLLDLPVWPKKKSK